MAVGSLGDSEMGCSLNDVSHLHALILDIDGVLYEGNRALPGAIELIEHLNKNNTPYVLFTNNTTNTLENHVTKLSRLGMRVPAASIITAASVAAKMIAQEVTAGTRCFVIGEAGLVEALLKVGLEVTQSEGDDIQYVVIGMDRQLTYEKLKIATRAILNGAHFISTNADPIYMDGDGIIPASGSIQAALEVATGIKAKMTGKPEPAGFLLALNQLGCSAEETGMLGDQPEIDLLGASRVGIKTFLIPSSLTQLTSPKGFLVKPDDIFKSTLDFYQAWMRRRS